MEEKLHIVDLAKGPSSLRTVETGISIGVTADIEGSDEVVLAAAKDGITKFNLQKAKHEYLAKFWDESDGPDKAKEYISEPRRRLSTYMLAACDRMTALQTAKQGFGLAQ